MLEALDGLMHAIRSKVKSSLRIGAKQPRLFTRCSQTPLDVFIDALVNKNLDRLVIYGKATQKQISDAWELLFTEYCEISGSPQYQRLVHLLRTIGSTRAKLLSVRACIAVLSHRYSERSVQTLRLFGYKYSFNVNDKISYANDLKSLEQKIKTSELSLIQTEKEYYELLNESENSNDDNYFPQTLIELSKYMGFRINPREITVSEFVLMQKRMLKEYEIIKNKKNGNKGQN